MFIVYTAMSAAYLDFGAMMHKIITKRRAGVSKVKALINS